MVKKIASSKKAQNLSRVSTRVSRGYETPRVHKVTPTVIAGNKVGVFEHPPHTVLALSQTRGCCQRLGEQRTARPAHPCSAGGHRGLGFPSDMEMLFAWLPFGSKS